MEWVILALIAIGIGVMVKFLSGGKKGGFGGGGGDYFDDFG